MNKKISSYFIGFIFNVIGFFVGSNFLINITSKLFIPSSEYESYVVWCITGSMVAWIANLIGVLCFAPSNFYRTLLWSIIGLFIAVLLSFIPYLYFLCMIAIFISCLLGHYSRGTRELNEVTP